MVLRRKDGEKSKKKRRGTSPHISTKRSLNYGADPSPFCYFLRRRALSFYHYLLFIKNNLGHAFNAPFFFTFLYGRLVTFTCFFWLKYFALLLSWGCLGQQRNRLNLLSPQVSSLRACDFLRLFSLISSGTCMRTRRPGLYRFSVRVMCVPNTQRGQLAYERAQCSVQLEIEKYAEPGYDGAVS